MSDSVLERLRQLSKDVHANSDVMLPDTLKDAFGRHNWRCWVPQQIASMWEDLTERERRLVMLTCEERVNNLD